VVCSSGVCVAGMSGSPWDSRNGPEGPSGKRRHLTLPCMMETARERACRASLICCHFLWQCCDRQLHCVLCVSS
jgi:hypothetical protein